MTRSMARDGWIVALTVTVAGGLASVAHADDTSAKACRDKAVSTIDIETCQKAALAEAEAALKTAYAKALAALPPDQKTKLVEAERRWVAFRQADCETYYGRQTGTIAGVEAGDCMIQHAKDRTRDLATFSEP